LEHLLNQSKVELKPIEEIKAQLLKEINFLKEYKLESEEELKNLAYQIEMVQTE
jgi:hypothetical protein